MAINELVRDLDLAPNVTRTVTLDLQSVIPVDNEGDEIYVTTATTTAVSKITGASITPIFLREFKVGYCKSSSFKNPPFTIQAGANSLRISIDGSSYYPITLSSGIGLSGEDVADDMQVQISALGGVDASAEGDLGFLNALVEFSENRFKITSGTVSNTYTGVGKSSVSVLPALTDDASVILGFNIPTESEALSSQIAKETILSVAFSGSLNETELNVVDVDTYATGHAFTITDGVNREYFVATDVDSGLGTLTVTSGSIANDYQPGAIVQRIFERDATGELASPYKDVDELVRFQLRSIANQIQF
jgi:hypothetical protein